MKKSGATKWKPETVVFKSRKKLPADMIVAEYPSGRKWVIEAKTYPIHSGKKYKTAEDVAQSAKLLKLASKLKATAVLAYKDSSGKVQFKSAATGRLLRAPRRRK